MVGVAKERNFLGGRKGIVNGEQVQEGGGKKKLKKEEACRFKLLAEGYRLLSIRERESGNTSRKKGH